MIQDKEPPKNKFRTKKTFFKAAAGAIFGYIPGTSYASWALFLLRVLNMRFLAHMVQQSPSDFGKWCQTAVRPSFSEKGSLDHPCISPRPKFSLLQRKFKCLFFAYSYYSKFYQKKNKKFTSNLAEKSLPPTLKVLATPMPCRVLPSGFYYVCVYVCRVSYIYQSDIYQYTYQSM